MNRRQKICFPLAIFFLVAALTFFAVAVWTEDKLHQERLAGTGALLLVPAAGFGLGSGKWQDW